MALTSPAGPRSRSRAAQPVGAPPRRRIFVCPGCMNLFNRQQTYRLTGATFFPKQFDLHTGQGRPFGGPFSLARYEGAPWKTLSQNAARHRRSAVVP